MELVNKCACSVQYRLANISNKCLLNEKILSHEAEMSETVSGPVARWELLVRVPLAA